MELYARLIDELGLSREQAEGAAGALLQLAQSRLSTEDFQQVADAIPAISDIIGKAPRFEVHPGGKLRAQLSRLFGGLGGLAPLEEPLSRLRIGKQSIPRCAEILRQYFEEAEQREVAEMLTHSWR